VSPTHQGYWNKLQLDNFREKLIQLSEGFLSGAQKKNGEKKGKLYIPERSDRPLWLSQYVLFLQPGS
jgi:hypothetical protein